MIQVLNEEIRELKTKAGTSSINDLMNRPTRQNFYGSRTEEGNDLRRQLQKKEEEMRILQDKYDKLYICKIALMQRKKRKEDKEMLAANNFSNANQRKCSARGKQRRGSSTKKKTDSRPKLLTQKNCPRKRTSSSANFKRHSLISKTSLSTRAARSIMEKQKR